MFSRCARRVPIMFQKWVGPIIYDHPDHRERLHRLLAEHPQDMRVIRWFNAPVWKGPKAEVIVPLSPFSYPFPVFLAGLPALHAVALQPA